MWSGLADVDGVPWRQDTIALLASATKGLVATAAMVLVDRGILDLDAPVAEHWPEFAAEGKAGIPLRWVLGHRSGVVAVDRPLTLAEMEKATPVADALAAARPAWRPGHAHGYHCLTMGWLVSETIRRVTGLTAAQFFAREIALPLWSICTSARAPVTIGCSRVSCHPPNGSSSTGVATPSSAR
ncbi:serine hydrolase domain-containing protein [Nonomuraea ceibae]|uniref:serine hydrolase domain-containing protein n=1 Tax=Nonomuraea ceibae TaxID=1935170 RepID=UPI001C5D8CE4|nr:serine hydrolase domain-containing protein [Nonomuraea ceibae]